MSSSSTIRVNQHQQRRTLFGFGKKKTVSPPSGDDASSSTAAALDPSDGGTKTPSVDLIDDSTTLFNTDTITLDMTNDATAITPTVEAVTATTGTTLTPEAEMAKFEQAAQALETTTPILAEWTATYWPHDQFINLLNFLQATSGISYAATIASTTIAIRVLLFPIFVSAQRNTSRMSHMRPELDALKAKIDASDQSDTNASTANAKAMQALFQKYDCNPLKAIVAPLAQAPVFMSMFFALRKLPDTFPERLSDGGALWFPDLTAPDPYMALPVLSAISFLLTIEAGKKQMLASSPDQGPMMLAFFRSLAVIMVPITMDFSAAVFCYWTTNNTVSGIQSVAFQNQGVRRALGIWDAPKPVPGAKKAKGAWEMVQDGLKARREKEGVRDEVEKIRMHNAAIDLENGSKILDREREATDAAAGVGRKRGKKRGGGKGSKRR